MTEKGGTSSLLYVCLGLQPQKTSHQLIWNCNLGDQSHLFIPKRLHHCALRSPGRCHLSR